MKKRWKGVPGGGNSMDEGMEASIFIKAGLVHEGRRSQDWRPRTTRAWSQMALPVRLARVWGRVRMEQTPSDCLVGTSCDSRVGGGFERA